MMIVIVIVNSWGLLTLDDFRGVRWNSRFYRISISYRKKTDREQETGPEAAFIPRKRFSTDQTTTNELAITAASSQRCIR